jgi:hypothetical protein
MGLIIPVQWLDDALPEDATDAFGALTNAVTQASAFCNTWATHYLEFEACTLTGTDSVAGADSSSSSSEADDDDWTINAPIEIAYMCLDIAKAIYWQNQGQVYRDGSEQETWTGILDGYRERLGKIEIAPTRHSVTISLDSKGYQLITRSPHYNILTHNAYITSATTNVWNLGRHYQIVRGACIDVMTYFTDGWYLDCRTYTNVEGTLYYYRTYRKDLIDYFKTFRNDLGYYGAYTQYSQYSIYPTNR